MLQLDLISRHIIPKNVHCDIKLKFQILKGMMTRLTLKDLILEINYLQ